MVKRTPREYIVRRDGKKNLRGFNIQIGEKRTTVRLSPGALQAIKKIAELEDCNTGKIFSYIYRTKEEGTSNATAIRDFAFKYFMDAATPEGHFRAGHGQLIREQRHRKNS
jgi:predicted DNA-binding ribbon-helix-helix protein